MGKPLRLRRIGYRDQASGKRYEFLTNHFGLYAKTIADISKERWQIELFFKEIKQACASGALSATRKTRSSSRFTPLTVYLLLAYQKFLSRSGLSVQQLFELIQLNLFGGLSLEERLNPRRRKNGNFFNLSLLDMVA